MPVTKESVDKIKNSFDSFAASYNDDYKNAVKRAAEKNSSFPRNLFNAITLIEPLPPEPINSPKTDEAIGALRDSLKDAGFEPNNLLKVIKNGVYADTRQGVVVTDVNFTRNEVDKYKLPAGSLSELLDSSYKKAALTDAAKQVGDVVKYNIDEANRIDVPVSVADRASLGKAVSVK